jgi:colicin import membrane protein
MLPADGGRLRPWIGSIVVHAAIVAALALAAVQWRTPPEPAQLAIEGNVVRYEDLPSSVKAGKPLREPVSSPKPEPAPAPLPEPEPRVQPQPEPPPPVEPDRAEQQRQADETAAREKTDAQAKAAAQKKLAIEREQAAEQKAQAAARAAKTKAAEEKRKQEELRQAEEQRKQAAADAKLKQAEQEKAAAAAKARAAKEAALQRELEAEEAGEALARSGVVDEYRTLLIQTIERNWNKPASARAGLVCTLNVTQAPGGTVTNVTIGDCNGDEAVRQSVINAVYRSSPLPPPRDARAFERRLVIVFKPTE